MIATGATAARKAANGIRVETSVHRTIRGKNPEIKTGAAQIRVTNRVAGKADIVENATRANHGTNPTRVTSNTAGQRAIASPTVSSRAVKTGPATRIITAIAPNRASSGST